MTSHERACQLARVIACLLIEVREQCGHEKTVEIFIKAVEKGMGNEQESN